MTNKAPADQPLDDLRAKAVEFPRKGHVFAERLEAPLRWDTERGSSLEGNAGDWLVSDGEGLWTVIDESFRANYELDGNRWLRTGSVLAVQVETALEVPTLEGCALALPGDWICWYPSSPECWPVSAERFTELYLAPEPSPAEQELRSTSARSMLTAAIGVSSAVRAKEPSRASRKVSIGLPQAQASAPTRAV